MGWSVGTKEREKEGRKKGRGQEKGGIEQIDENRGGHWQTKRRYEKILPAGRKAGGTGGKRSGRGKESEWKIL